jgi:predicted ATPase
MSAGPDAFIVVTGGPGAGKTTLISALAARGFATMPEAGRAVIKAQGAAGGKGLPWADRALFAELMLAADIESHRLAHEREGPVIFDRGIPDIAGYLALCGLPVPERLDRAMRQCRYARKVLLAPPWRAIFGQDAERRQDFDEAQRTCRMVAAAYAGQGYELLELPRVSVEARVAFVIAQLGPAPARGRGE